MVLALGRSAVLQEKANRFSLLWWVSGKSVDGDMVSTAPQPATWYEKNKNMKIQIIQSSGWTKASWGMVRYQGYQGEPRNLLYVRLDSQPNTCNSGIRLNDLV